MIQVFKFGGASVRDRAAIQNLASILTRYPAHHLVVVISALGKTTNKLEEVVHAYLHHGPYTDLIKAIEEEHVQICRELNISRDAVCSLINGLRNFLHLNISLEYDFLYDQVVSYGERMSTVMVSEYLNSIGYRNQLLDVREMIYTDNTFTDARVDFAKTEKAITKVLAPLLPEQTLITQGFLGCSESGDTTTLGREGSDYSGAIFAYALRADNFTIWKDVDGVYNADPKLYPEAQVIPFLSYKEVIEMTFYGAKVIHPKTIKPLQNRCIPMEVRSFLHPDKEGTKIRMEEAGIPYPAIFVQKSDQCLLSFSVKDFSFIAEDAISRILQVFHKNHLRINLMQNTAISFSLCVDPKPERIERIVRELKNEYSIRFNEQLELLTVRHYDQFKLAPFIQNKELVLEQKTRNTLQLLLRKKE